MPTLVLQDLRPWVTKSIGASVNHCGPPASLKFEFSELVAPRSACAWLFHVRLHVGELLAHRLDDHLDVPLNAMNPVPFPAELGHLTRRPLVRILHGTFRSARRAEEHVSWSPASKIFQKS